MPARTAAPLPPLRGSQSKRTRGSRAAQASTMDAVLSRLPSSTTTTSQDGCPAKCAVTASSVAAMRASPLKTGMMMV